MALVNKYDGEFPVKYFSEFLDYLSMEKDEFFEIADSFRSPHLWSKNKNKWELRYKIK